MDNRLGDPEYLDAHLMFYSTLLKVEQKRNILDIVRFDDKILETIKKSNIIPSENYVLYLKQIASHRNLKNG